MGYETMGGPNTSKDAPEQPPDPTQQEQANATNATAGNGQQSAQTGAADSQAQVTKLGVANAEVIQPAKGQYGFRIAITWQLEDSKGDPVSAQGYKFQEEVHTMIQPVGSEPQHLVDKKMDDIGPNKPYTNQLVSNAQGQFKDAPYGARGTTPTEQPFTSWGTQKIQVIPPNGGKPISFGTNNISQAGKSSGQGTISVTNKQFNINIQCTASGCTH
jgi:hypothetical protein